uniref:Uncharacterized protein n=1 Tax=Arion vulgaris TaxID=1028688 RepID=A0A0B7B5N9_9EUPU
MKETLRKPVERELKDFDLMRETINRKAVEQQLSESFVEALYGSIKQPTNRIEIE